MSQAGLINVNGGGGGGSPILSLTPDIGGPTFPTASNIDVFASGTNTGITVRSGSTINFNAYTPANWIVDPIANKGTHQTITAATAAASAGDIIFIREGTYIESFSPKAGVNYVALSTNAVTINGTLTITTAGGQTFTGIQFANTTGNCVTISGSAFVDVSFYSCLFSVMSGTGVANTNANVSVLFSNCQITNSSAQFLTSTAGTIQLSNCIETSSLTPIANSITGGGLIVQDSYFITPFAISTNCTFTDSYFDSSSFNRTPLIFTGSASAVINQCKALGGTASGITIGTGYQVAATNLTISSSNTNAIAGTGGLQYSDISFSTSSSTIQSTISTSFFPFRSGPAQSGTFTPVLNFGGATTGITYSVQSGRYSQIGNILHYKINLSLTSVGSATGAATLTGFPVTAANDNTNNYQVITDMANIAPTGVMSIGVTANSTSASFIYTTTAGVVSNSTNATWNNNTVIVFSGWYFTS